ATSEELAAQAETLQATIAYFRIDGSEAAAGSRVIDGAVSQLRATASRMAAPSAAVKSPARTTTRSAAKPRSGSPRGSGFAFDLTSAEDTRDQDFKRA
ncbi:methyl-accepting chemotaxis protein, partial [Methylobacterium sp. EM32]